MFLKLGFNPSWEETLPSCDRHRLGRFDDLRDLKVNFSDPCRVSPMAPVNCRPDKSRTGGLNLIVSLLVTRWGPPRRHPTESWPPGPGHRALATGPWPPDPGRRTLAAGLMPPDLSRRLHRSNVWLRCIGW